MRYVRNHFSVAFGWVGRAAIVVALAVPTTISRVAFGRGTPPPEYELFIVPQVRELRGVNDLGVAVGISTAVPVRAYGFNNGSTYGLGSATGYLGESSGAYDINNNGTVAAYSNKYNVVTGQYENVKPYIILNGLWTVLDPCSGTARAVNLADQATGDVGVGDNCQNPRAFFYENGNLTTLSTLGGSTTYPGGASWGLGINNAGVVVGQSTISTANTYRGIVRQPSGTIQQLASLGGFTDIAMDINDDGIIAGYSQVPGGDIRCVIWIDGQLINLHPAGSPYSEATAINNNLEVVGESNGRATLWRGAEVIDLNTLVTLPPGVTLRIAYDISDTGYIVGRCITPSGLQGFLLKPVPADTDDDGLLDDWELHGVPYTDSFGATQRYVLDTDGDGIAECDPEHKDLFVEIDAMNGLAPSTAALSRVVNAFAAAPVTNPDGTTGVALHYVLDDTNIPVAGWTVDNIDADPQPDWPTEFDALKLTASSGTTLPGYFGTTIERNDPDGAGIRSAKTQAYRYCIFAREQNPGDSTSGRAELPGNDFMVTLGLWSPAGGTTDQQAGTFMHELGHTLGLGHGGRAADGTPDHINYKPNYYSIMSYNWQMPMAWMSAGSWPLDGARSGYSEFAVSTILNEAAADDCLPALVVPGSSLAGVRFPFNTTNDGASPPDVRLGRFDIATDWRNDGTPQCGVAALPVDLNRMQSNHPASPGQTLIGRDDWSVLVYDFKITPSYPPGVHNPDLGAEAETEMDFATHVALSIVAPPNCTGDVNNDRSVNVTDLLTVISTWGACPQGCAADIAPSPADGQVNVTDLLAVIGAWGPCP